MVMFPCTCVGKFLGVVPRMPQLSEFWRTDKNGKPLACGMEWQFEVVEGEAKGQMVSCITGAYPTPHNLSGVFLSGLVGRPLKLDEDIDPSPFVSRLYQLVVSPVDPYDPSNPVKTYISEIRAVPGQD